jgi:hypothetical protein
VTEIMDELKALLEAAGFAVHLVSVPDGATYPYVLVWCTPGQPGIEPGIVTDSDLSDLIGVTMVHTTPRNALVLTGKVRAAIPAHLVVGGQLVWLSRSASQAVQPDRDVTLPTTNAHPFFAVDRYQLVATAA